MDHNVFSVCMCPSMTACSHTNQWLNGFTGAWSSGKLIVQAALMHSTFSALSLAVLSSLFLNPGRREKRTLLLDPLWLRLYARGGNWKPHHRGVVVWKSTLHELKAQRVIRSLPAHGAWLVWNQIENIAFTFQWWKMRKTWLAAWLSDLFEWILFL